MVDMNMVADILAKQLAETQIKLATVTEALRFYRDAWEKIPTGYEGEDDYTEPSVELRNGEGERARAALAKINVGGV